MNGDRYSRQFFSGFKSKKSCVIQGLRKPDQQEAVTDSNEMLRIAEEFYCQLYTAE